MASLIAKKKANKLYYYVVESARVDGKPRIVHQTYLGRLSYSKLSLIPWAWTNSVVPNVGNTPTSRQASIKTAGYSCPFWLTSKLPLD